jgi:hypothetical protein
VQAAANTGSSCLECGGAAASPGARTSVGVRGAGVKTDYTDTVVTESAGVGLVMKEERCVGGVKQF